MHSIIVSARGVHAEHYCKNIQFDIFLSNILEQFSIFKEYINLKYPSIQSQFGMTEIQHSPQPQTLVS